jgi:hypothetical protein
LGYDVPAPNAPTALQGIYQRAMEEIGIDGQVSMGNGELTNKHWDFIGGNL